MWLLALSLTLLVLRFFEVWVFAGISWWWVSGAFLLCFLWFEYIEGLLGLEAKKAMDEMDAAKKRRIARALEREQHRVRR